MDKDTYNNTFKPWYESVKDETWNYKEEMIRYCRADVVVLSKAVLKVRKMFKDKFDINPFRYVTLASLCMAIFRGGYLEDKTIVSNEPNKPVSQVCKEWLNYLNDPELATEIQIQVKPRQKNREL